MLDHKTALDMQNVIAAVVARTRVPKEAEEDCKQAGFVALYDADASWDKYKGIAFTSWAWFYIVKAVRKEAEFYADLIPSDERVPEELLEETTPEDELESFYDSKKLYDLLPELPVRQQEALLGHICGWSYGDIAKDMNISRQAAHRLVSRGTRTLRNLVKSLD